MLVELLIGIGSMYLTQSSNSYGLGRESVK
jgi:hypothetical protein